MKGLLLFITISVFASGGIITSPPVDSVSCCGGIATFYCGSDRGSDVANIQWIVDGEDFKQINNDELVMRGLSTHTSISNNYAASNLTIVGVPVNDGVVVQCAMVTYSFDSDTEAAIFTVTDIPPVTNLSIEFTGTIMNITWDAPSVLPANYHYLINITTNGNVTTSNTTVDPVYTMSISSCSSNYTVSVSVVDIGYTQLHSVPVNRAEQSNDIEAISGSLIISINSLNVEFKNSRDCFINLKLKINRPYASKSPQSLPCIIPSVVVNTTSLYPPDVYSEITPMQLSELIRPNITEYFSLGPYNRHFRGILSISLEANPSDVSHIFFSTFNTQNFTISTEPNDGTVKATCIFASNSSADGCQVIFTSSLAVVVVDRFISKDINELTCTDSIRVEEGNYTVTIHDVVEGERIEPAACTREYEITYSSQFAAIEPSGLAAWQMSSLVSPSVPLSVATTSNIISEGILATVVTVSGFAIVFLCTTVIVIGVAVYISRKSRKTSQVTNIYDQNLAYERVNVGAFTPSKTVMTSNNAYEVVTAV